MREGLMMDDYPLSLTNIVQRAERLSPQRKVAFRRPDGSVGRCTFGDCAARARRLSSALAALGIESGDVVATLMWNQPEHVEVYFAAPSMGAVLHTLNPRLHPDELSFIVNDAEDRAIILDESLLEVFESFHDARDFEHVIVVGRDTPVPDGYHDYEALIAGAEPMEWPQADERSAAAMCYTSGTTGRPKGVVYSHRALALHSLATALPDANDLSARDTVLPVVPMFHANAWGLIFTSALVGAALVLPGPRLDAESILELLADEGVTATAGVPTVWMMMLQALDAEPDRWDLSKLRMLLVGGSAVPRSMLVGFDRHGLTILQAWGMTETSPVGSAGRLPVALDDAGSDAQYDYRARQGVPLPFIEIRGRGDDGELIPWDDTAMGELEVRGPWVARAYHQGQGAEKFSDDGWFATGDVVTIDATGNLKICDRSKDLVKSGGEWISSVDLENLLMAHDAVAEAAVIAIPDERWGERPLAVVVVRDDRSADAEDLKAHLATQYAKWQIPDRFEFIEEIPRTATGKFKKTALRDMYVDTTV
ncbi:MAG TPA: long-chain fatty acid--CoA ligase [Solirubrobacteraceae bacterium]|nr:long-chain fatty acid--CoA ligase [Solirubrobacteraceae bacterium]